MIENEDKCVKQFEKIIDIENFDILENIYLIHISILKNYLRLYY